MGRTARIKAPEPQKKVAMLVDVSDCIGCKGCQIACKQWNQLTAETTSFTGSYQSHKSLTENTWTVINFTEMKPTNAKIDSPVQWNFQKHNCMHCAEAACEMSCPVNAISHRPNGIVHIDTKACIGCGYCEQVCPFDAVHVEKPAGKVGFNTGKAGKCTLCVDRAEAGLNPACVQACPTDCIKFGERDALIAWGEERVKKLKERGFANANLYGKNELGGLNQLYVLAEKPSVYGLPENPRIPGTLQLWKSAVKPAGKAVLGAVAFGLVVNYAIATVSRLSVPDKGGHGSDAAD